MQVMTNGKQRLEEVEESYGGREVGVVLMASSHEILAFDRGAADILNGSSQGPLQAGPEVHIPREILESIRRIKPGTLSPLRTHFQIGELNYVCSTYLMEFGSTDFPLSTITVHIERDLSASEALLDVINEYHLTGREQEVLRGIAIGLTSKEVANRMNISPNTVKAFLRLIMIKMGVTTRSGIVGRLLEHSAGRHVAESRMLVK